MIPVQIYLRTNSLGKLIMEHGVYASLSKNRMKISLNYDQIETKEDDVLSWDCRGLILAKTDGSEFQTIDAKLNLDVIVGDTQILAFGMRRFFNYGQGSAAEINWHDPKLAVLEKLDGTLCIVYWDGYLNQWCVATRSVPEADLLMDNGIFTFRTLFEKALYDTTRGLPFNQFTSLLDKNYTYCFELTTPYNRIVVYYPDNRVTLLAVRNMITLKEVELQPFLDSHVITHLPVVQSYNPKTIEELADWVSTLNPMEHEGVVVRDGKFNRIKLKNAAYVAASKIRETLATSPRNCLELILLGKDDDAASFLPQEIQVNLASLKNKFVLWLKGQEVLAQTIIEEARSIAPDKKTFALTVQRHKPDVPAALFAIYDNKANSIKSFIENNRKEGTWSNSFIDKILYVI